METIKVETIFLNYAVSITVRCIGEDVSVLCIGGSRPHIGGVAMALPYAKSGGTGVAVSVLSAPGHQDARLAGQMAKVFCKQTKRQIFVQCGIHYTSLSPGQLRSLERRVLAMCRELTAGFYHLHHKANEKTQKRYPLKICRVP